MEFCSIEMLPMGWKPMRMNSCFGVTIILKWWQDRRNFARRNHDLEVFVNWGLSITTIKLVSIAKGIQELAEIWLSIKTVFTVHSIFLIILLEILWITSVAKRAALRNAGKADINIDGMIFKTFHIYTKCSQWNV